MELKMDENIANTPSNNKVMMTASKVPKSVNKNDLFKNFRPHQNSWRTFPEKNSFRSVKNS